MSEKIIEGTPSSALSVLPFILSSLGNPKITKVASQAIAIGMAGKLVWEFCKRFKKESDSTSIVVNEKTDFYDYVRNWIAAAKIEYDGSEFELIAKNNDEVFDTQKIPEPSEFKFIPSGLCKTLVGDIVVMVEQQLGERNSDNRKYTKDKLILTIQSKKIEDLNIVCSAIEEIGKRYLAKPITTVYSQYWRDWNAIRKIYKVKDVILPNNQFDHLKNYVSEFLENRDWYEDTNVKWNLGVLLYGISGSGKSTTIQALATHFNLDVYVINLNEINDNDFMRAVSAIPECSILILEDIDAAFNDRKAEDTKVTFSGLLNVLDGVATPEGRITIMTTNHIDKLDPALIRPGRCDIKIEYVHASYEQIIDLVGKFGYDEIKARELTSIWAIESLTMAEVQNRLIQLHQENKNVRI